MNIDISISRKGVMGIVEGISVTIAQHNNGTPTFEQLWASDNESPKLDIYYREGIGDLERRLEKWISNSSAQFDLQAVGSDYTLSLELNDNWPSKLKGLLSNKVQDYMVHAITAGWLNDFEGLNVKQDYQAMAATDLDDIEYIIGLKTFGFDESARGTDTDKDTTGVSTGAGARTADNDAAVNGNAQNTAEERTADADKENNGYAVEAEARTADNDAAVNGSTQNAAEERTADADKENNGYAVEAEARTADNDIAVNGNTQNSAGERATDAEKANDEATQGTAGERSTDAEKDADGYAVEAGARTADNDAAVNGNAQNTAGERTADAEKTTDDNAQIAGGERHDKNDTDIALKGDAQNGAGERNKDNAEIMIPRDFTDWSGVGVPFFPMDVLKKRMMQIRP